MKEQTYFSKSASLIRGPQEKEHHSQKSLAGDRMAGAKVLDFLTEAPLRLNKASF